MICLRAWSFEGLSITFSTSTACCLSLMVVLVTVSVFLYSDTARVMSFSAMGRTSFARLSVVTSFPFQRNAVTILRSMASRWSVALFSLRLGIKFPPKIIWTLAILSSAITRRYRAKSDPERQASAVPLPGTFCQDCVLSSFLPHRARPTLQRY